MKAIGVIFMGIGVFGGVLAMLVSTAAPGTDILNLGLVPGRSDILMIACTLFVSGAIFVAAGDIVASLRSSNQEQHPKPDKHQKDWERLDADKRRREMEYVAEVAAVRQRKDEIREHVRQRRAGSFGSFLGRIDGGLRSLAGADNAILYRFLQIFFYVIVPLAIAVVAVLVSQKG